MYPQVLLSSSKAIWCRCAPSLASHSDAHTHSLLVLAALYSRYHGTLSGMVCAYAQTHCHASCKQEPCQHAFHRTYCFGWHSHPTLGRVPLPSSPSLYGACVLGMYVLGLYVLGTSVGCVSLCVHSDRQHRRRTQHRRMTS